MSTTRRSTRLSRTPAPSEESRAKEQEEEEVELPKKRRSLKKPEEAAETPEPASKSASPVKKAKEPAVSPQKAAPGPQIETSTPNASKEKSQNESPAPTGSASKYQTRRKVICFKESSSSDVSEEEVMPKKKRNSRGKKKDDDQDFEIEKVAKALVSSSSSEEELVEEAEEPEDLADLGEPAAKTTTPEAKAVPIVRAKKKYVYNYKKTPEEIAEEERNNPNLVHTFDLEAKVERWTYEIDEETRVFCKPVLPMLSDKAIEPFISAKSKKKSIIYECPHCHKPFTYTLVFKSHLYSCPSNKNVPKYVLFCGLYPQCPFVGQRKQEMINHFRSSHSSTSQVSEAALGDLGQAAFQIDIVNGALGGGGLEATPPPLSTTKKSQMEVSHYSFVDKRELKFTQDLYYQYVSRHYRRLKALDAFFAGEKKADTFERFVLETKRPAEAAKAKSAASVLKLAEELPDLSFDLAGLKQQPRVAPFESYEHPSAGPDSPAFLLVNAVGHVTALDWAPVKGDDQYLAFATLPLRGLSKSYNELRKTPNASQNEPDLVYHSSFGSLIETPNLIYLLKMSCLGGSAPARTELFAYLNAKIGCIYSLRFRPDFGASYSQREADSNFIGYLLATGSNGNAYIVNARDMSQLGKTSKTAGLNVLEEKRQVVLRTRFAFGQCTAGDWSSLNGATQIATGYANGSIALFSVSSASLASHLVTGDSEGDDILNVYPLRTFLAHETYVRVVRWSKLNPSVLASGALFSREIKVWSLNNTNSALMNYEIFCTDLVFSLHSNEVFITRETNLKGENHLCALDLGYNVQYHDKDASRAHSSLFFTLTTMNSLDQSDFFNKLLICDNSGSVMVTKANNSKYWLQKNKLMNISYSQVVKFSAVSQEDKESKEKTALDNSYNLEELVKKKPSTTILVEFDQASFKPKPSANANNPIAADLNNLTKIRWNPNADLLNWYAVSSLSGFIFIHRVNELSQTLAPAEP